MAKSKPASSTGFGYYSPSEALSSKDFWDLTTPRTRQIWVGMGFCIFSFALCWGWAAFGLNNTFFLDEYTNLDTGVYRNTRYQWEWFFLYFLSFNLFLPWMLVFFIVNNAFSELVDWHRFLSNIFMILNLGLFIALFFWGLFVCNTSWSPFSTACNDPKYCCNYYGSAQIWCKNTIDCVCESTNTECITLGAATYFGDLRWSWPFWISFVFAGVFGVMAWLHKRMNLKLVAAGVLAPGKSGWSGRSG